MAKDAELDRLKAAQDLAFQRKQNAFDTMQRAWEKLSFAREELSRAHAEKQRAFEAQDLAWKNLDKIASANGPRIEQLNSLQERAYEQMKRCFENAASAYDNRDGAAAKSYADEGHGYKAEAQRLVTERRQLVEEIKGAKARLESAKAVFSRAKADFAIVKQRFEKTKQDHEQAQVDFKLAKDAFNESVKLFRLRLEQVKNDSKKRKKDKIALAIKAGIPAEYIDRCWIKIDSEGNVNIYFGGIDTPDGPGHGHYCMNKFGKITYRREPLDSHGPQNFIDSIDTYESRIVKELNSSEFGFWCRFRGYEAYAESNFNKEGRAKIDIYYGPNGPFGPGHHHAVAYKESPFDFVYDGLR